jgi:hypothetical protein
VHPPNAKQVIERGERSLDRPLLQTTDLPNALGNMVDGSVGSSVTGTELTAEALEQVGTK